MSVIFPLFVLFIFPTVFTIFPEEEPADAVFVIESGHVPDGWSGGLSDWLSNWEDDQSGSPPVRETFSNFLLRVPTRESFADFLRRNTDGNSNLMSRDN
jgi:hypothetical protein